MRSAWVRGCLVLSLLGGVWAGSAQAGGDGVSALFLDEPVGPRAAAMGEAFSAVAEDVNTLYWNPAGLVRLESKALMVTHAQSFQGFRHDYVALGVPWSEQEGFGIQAFVNYSDAMEKWNADGEPNGSFYQNEGYLGLLWSHAWDTMISTGLNLKGLVQSIDTYSAWSVACDAGVYGQNVGMEGLNLSLTLRNLGKPLRFLEQDYPLNTSVVVGGSYRLWQSVLVTLDMIKPWQQEMAFKAGAEYTFQNVICFRAGYKYLQYGNDLGAWSGLSLGLGLEISDYQVDYAYAPYGPLGDAHRVGITLPFGRSVVEEQKFIRRLEEQLKSKQSAMVQNLIREGDSAVIRLAYDQALKAYHKALNMQPEYKDLPEKIRQTEAAQHARVVDQQVKAGDRAYAAKDYLTAMVEWSKVLNLAPEHAEAKRKLEAVNEKLAQEKIATANHQNQKVIQQYVSDGLKQLEKREYSKAIAVWERILQMDPGNARVQQYLNVTRVKLRDAVQQLLSDANDDWERGRYVEAVSKWRQSMELEDGQAVAVQKLRRYQPEIQKLVNETYLQGVQAYVQNDLKTATAAWKRVLILDPTHPKASKHLKNVNTKIEELDALH